MYGIYPLIKLNRLIGGHRLKFLGILAARRFGLRHLFLRVDPIVACNLECLMCPYSDPLQRNEPNVSFTDDELDRIAGNLFPKALQVVVGCSYEPTMASNFLRVLELARIHRVPHTGLVSNGQLLKTSQLEDMQELGLGELTLSLHGVTKETYESMMVRASYDRFLTLLQTVSRLKNGRSSTLPRLRLNYTVNRNNLDELDDFFDVFGNFPISTLQVRPMFNYRQNTLAMRPEDFVRYRSKMAYFQTECRKRNFSFLANTQDPGFEKPNFGTLVLPYIYYFIDPHAVWRPDFDWRRESHDEFCRKIRHDRSLVRGIFSRKEDLLVQSARYADSVGYELS